MEMTRGVSVQAPSTSAIGGEPDVVALHWGVAVCFLSHTDRL
jgi:hypothetical protein